VSKNRQCRRIERRKTELSLYIMLLLLVVVLLLHADADHTYCAAAL
jgi:hypothetical protein